MDEKFHLPEETPHNQQELLDQTRAKIDWLNSQIKEAYMDHNNISGVYAGLRFNALADLPYKKRVTDEDIKNAFGQIAEEANQKISNFELNDETLAEATEPFEHLLARHILKPENQ